MEIGQSVDGELLNMDNDLNFKLRGSFDENASPKLFRKVEDCVWDGQIVSDRIITEIVEDKKKILTLWRQENHLTENSAI